MRVMGGEDPAVVAGELGVTVTDLSVWKDKFILGGTEGLKRREQDNSQEVQELRAKVGEMTMQLELYRKNRSAPGRSRCRRCPGPSAARRHERRRARHTRTARGPRPPPP